MFKPTQPTKLQNKSIYFVNGKLARFTGTYEVGSRLPIFSAHGEEIIAPLSKVATVDREGVDAYMGR